MTMHYGRRNENGLFSNLMSIRMRRKILTNIKHKKQKDPQKKHRLGMVSKSTITGGLKLASQR